MTNKILTQLSVQNGEIVASGSQTCPEASEIDFGSASLGRL